MCRSRVRLHDEDDPQAQRPSGLCALCEVAAKHPAHTLTLALALSVKLGKTPGQNNVMGSSVPFILDSLGLDDRAFASAFAAGTFGAALVQPLLGLMLDARGLRFCMPVGLVALGVGLLLLSYAEGLLTIFVAFVLIRATAIGCLDAWASAAITLWFTQYRGRAMAVMMVVAGLPTGLVASAMQASDRQFGWRLTLRFVVLLHLGLAGLCGTFLVNPPKGLRSSAAHAAQASTQMEAAAGDGSAAEADTEVDEAATPTKHAAAASASRDVAEAAEGHSPTDGPSAAARHPPWLSRRTYTLAVLYSSIFIITSISGGIDLFTVVMARGRYTEGDPPYDVAALVCSNLDSNLDCTARTACPLAVPLKGRHSSLA